MSVSRSPGSTLVRPAGPRRAGIRLGSAWVSLLCVLALACGDKAAIEVPAAGLTVRCLSPSIQPAEDGVGLVVHGDAVAEVEVISDEPLEAIAMEFGPDAPARLELEGGAVGNRLFRPDGGVVFEVLVVGGTRLPGGGRSYRLSFFLPDAPEQPIGVIFRPQATGSTFAPS